MRLALEVFTCPNVDRFGKAKGSEGTGVIGSDSPALVIPRCAKLEGVDSCRETVGSER